MPAINENLQGRYRIKRQLGFGGMGAVYEAEDTKRFGKSVALKEILIDLSKAPTARQQEMLMHAFEREAKILTQLDHEAFPQVIDYFTETDRQYLVMELVHGEDLGDRLGNDKKPFSVEEVLRFADQLLEALDYLHTLSQPIIHRDIKPQNLKITARGKVKLLDFGIAKGSDAQINFTISNQTFLAATLNYSPFEQILRVLEPSFVEALKPVYGEKIDKILAHPTDASTDIYALGATLYHFLTNRTPIDALKRTLEVWKGSSDPLLNPRQLNSAIPPEIAAWLYKAVAIEREDRFASALEMQEALRTAIASEKAREEEGKKQVWFNEQENLKRERDQIDEERKRIEAERLVHLKQIEDAKHQAGFEKQRLQEAEQRATDAEKRFLDQQSKTVAAVETQPTYFVEEKPSVAETQASISSADITMPALIPPPSSKLVQDLSIGSTPAEKKKKIGWLAPAAVVAVLFFSAVGMGMWFLLSKSNDTSNANTSDVKSVVSPTVTPSNSPSPAANVAVNNSVVNSNSPQGSAASPSVQKTPETKPVKPNVEAVKPPPLAQRTPKPPAQTPKPNTAKPSLDCIYNKNC